MGWLFLSEIMTTVYFAKRCKSDRKVIDERNRPLTDEGVSDSYKVMEMLKDKKLMYLFLGYIKEVLIQ